MKRYLIITVLLFLFCMQHSMAYSTYTRYYPAYGTYNQGLIYRPAYNPYSYQYRKYNSNNLQRLQRLQRTRLLNKIRRNIYGNFLTLMNNNTKNGVLTGYSVPINQDIYNQMGIMPYNQEQTARPSSSKADFDLFSVPQGDEMYYNDGRFHKNLGGASGKTGVTIIYD